MKKFLLGCACVVLVAASAALMLGCGGGGSQATTGGSGRLTLGVTDAPVDGATAVVVRFTAVELKPAGGDAFTVTLDPAQTIDLLALAGGNSRALLSEHTVPAGRYEWLRLIIDVRGFTVAAGSVSNFTIDFDLRKSVIAPPGQAPNYLLKPVLRIVDNLQVGTIAGTVATALVPAGCAPYVYVFAGAGVTPDDLDAAPSPDVDPLISVPVTLDAMSGEYRFRAAFVEVGDYTATFTCNGDLDTPEGEEALVFAGTHSLTVSANQTATINFAP
jgi:hypothetical protein